MKRGFTLIELLVVISILGLLGLIVGFSVTETLKKVKDDTSNILKNNLIDAAKNWASSNIYILPEEGKSIVINLQNLVIDGFIELDDDNQIRDTKNSKYISKTNTLITITNNNGDYEYSLDLEYGEDNINLRAPAIVLLGEKEMTITGNYNEPGFYAYDYEKDIIYSVEIKIVDQNGVEVSSITTSGTYTITYTVTDSNGTSSINRIVIKN